MNSSQICHALHEWAQKFELHTFPFSEDDIPWNGIYILFETNESGHGDDRIVRVGTHRGDDQLPSRLTQHFLSKNKDRSIFRKNIGRCFLNKENDPYLDVWNIDMTSRAKRDKYGHLIDAKKQAAIERDISAYIQDKFGFVVIEVDDPEYRLWLEEKMIATVSQCNECGPSSSWLGNNSPERKIRERGLWQVQGLDSEPFSEDIAKVMATF